MAAAFFSLSLSLEESNQRSAIAHLMFVFQLHSRAASGFLNGSTQKSLPLARLLIIGKQIFSYCNICFRFQETIPTNRQQK